MTAEATLQQINRLSIWDISHYWHDFNPQTSSPSRLPLEVQKTLRALAAKAGRSLYLRCGGKSLVYRTLTGPDGQLPLSYVRRVYRREFKYAIEGRKYKRTFLSGINMSRIGLLVWCRENGIKPPAFWFSEDDPLLARPVGELGRRLAPEEIVQYGLVMLFDEAPELEDGARRTSGFNMSGAYPVFKERDSVIEEAISRINRGNAKARFAPAAQLKREYKDFYLAKSYENKSQAARDFFDGLSREQRKILVPIYNEKEHAKFYEHAVRNLFKVFKH